MRVDFYQLSRDPAPVAAAMLAGKTMAAGQRLLIVSADAAQLADISAALWATGPESFLANGMAGGPDDARQPILLSAEVNAANGSGFLMLADGQWREPGDGFARVMLLFDNATIDGARGAWLALGQAEGVDRHFWKQQDGRWVEGP